MLWHSIAAGFKIFTFWQTYVVAIGVNLIIVPPKLYLALLQDKNMYGETTVSPLLIWYLVRHHAIDRFDKLIERATNGSIIRGFKSLLFIGLLEFLGVYFAILTLLTVMLGLTNDANWLLPWILPFKAPILFLKLLGIILLSVWLVFQVPIVGEMLGGMLIYPIMVAVMAEQLEITHKIMIPNFWIICGIMLSCVVIKYALIGIFALTVAFIPTKLVYSSVGGAAKLFGFCLLSPTINLLPAFIYAGWMTLQLQ
jgi:hypothetical protein